MFVARGKAERPKPWDKSVLGWSAPQGIGNRGTAGVGVQGRHGDQCESESESEGAAAEAEANHPRTETGNPFARAAHEQDKPFSLLSGKSTHVHSQAMQDIHQAGLRG